MRFFLLRSAWKLETFAAVDSCEFEHNVACVLDYQFFAQFGMQCIRKKRTKQQRNADCAETIILGHIKLASVNSKRKCRWQISVLQTLSEAQWSYLAHLLESIWHFHSCSCRSIKHSFISWRMHNFHSLAYLLLLQKYCRFSSYSYLFACVLCNCAGTCMRILRASKLVHALFWNQS